MEQPAKHHLTLDEYNQLEEETSTRYEYHDGEVFAMAGGDPKHSVIAGTLITLLTNALRSKGKGCTPFTSDTKFYIPSINRSLYPDVSVVCRPFERSTQDIRALANPILLIEVLSKGTANYDRGTKFHYFSELPTLREYVLVEQDTWKIETRYRSSPTELWQMNWFQADRLAGGNAEIPLHSVDITLSLADIYREVEGL